LTTKYCHGTLFLVDDNKILSIIKGESIMAAKQKVFGPYRVKNIGASGPVYEVVEMVDNHSNTWQELRPRCVYATSKNPRQAAYGKCLRLNKRWQEEMEETFETEILEYWKKATN
jgi:hypothetical protein